MTLMLSLASCRLISDMSCANSIEFGAEAHDYSSDIDEFNHVTFSTTVEAEGLTKDEIYSRSRVQFAYLFGSANSVIQLEERDQGVLIGKGYTYGTYKQNVKLFSVYSPFSYYYVLKIECKDGKARVFFTVNTVNVGISNFTSYYPYTNIKPRGVYSKNGNSCVAIHIKNTAEYTIEKITLSITKGSTGTENEDW